MAEPLTSEQRAYVRREIDARIRKRKGPLVGRGALTLDSLSGMRLRTGVIQATRLIHNITSKDISGV